MTEALNAQMTQADWTDHLAKSLEESNGGNAAIRRHRNEVLAMSPDAFEMHKAKTFNPEQVERVHVAIDRLLDGFKF